LEVEVGQPHLCQLGEAALCDVRTLVLPNMGRSSSRSFRTSRACAALGAVTLTCRIRPSASRIRVSAITRSPRRRTAIDP